MNPRTKQPAPRKMTAAEARTARTARTIPQAEVGELVKPTLTERQALFINHVPPAVADDLLVRSLAEQMHGKMTYNREGAGREGWHTTVCTDEGLKRLLRELVDKQDYLDAAIVAGMLLIREQMAMSA